MPETLSLCEKLTELQNTSSRLEKQAILAKYKDDKDFTYVLKFLCDNLIVTGISDKKISRSTNISPTHTNLSFIGLLNYLKEHNTGTDQDVSNVQCVLDNVSTTQNARDILTQIVTKSLNLGVDKKTCNSVYGKDFIPSLDVMLGTNIENCSVPQGTWFSISRKLNGTRCFYYKGNLYTRQGKQYTGCDHIINDIKKLLEPWNGTRYDIVFDGELILKDSSLSDSEAFQKGTGIANSKDKDKSDLKLVIFDYLPRDEFEKGESTLTYKERSKGLDIWKQSIKDKNLNNLSIVERVYAGTDQSYIWKWLEYAEQHDWEGIMLNLDTPYECKRTKNLIKVKKFYTYDLRVIDVEEGTGRNKGKLGAVVCEFDNNTVKVGSGFNDEFRDYYWKNSGEIIGRIIEVKYKEVTTNKDTGLKSLQFPVFISIRELGKEPSIN